MSSFIDADGQVNRFKVVRAANEAGRLSRYPGAPILHVEATRETLTEWLQHNDPNGCHTDDLAARSQCDPYDVDRAWEAIAEMVSDDE